MPAITAEIQLGAYLSIIKLIVFVIGFFAWLPLLVWVNNDAKNVRTDSFKWTLIILIAGAAGTVIWLLTPLFAVGLPIYIITLGTASIVYVMHRNSLVGEFQKVLTIDHIKSLFVNEEKELEKINKGLSFVTANKNKAPAPEPKTPEFFGYKTAQEFFDDAIQRRAGDIVLTPGQQYQIHFIVDGVPEKQPPRQREECEYFIRYLKNLADLDVEEKRKPQKGRFTVQKDNQPFEWEVTTAGTTAGEQAKLRLLAAHNILKLAELGLTPEQLEQFQSIRQGTKGVFIVSGPKKSGVTTTFYALMRNHDPFINNINVLEKRPIGELQNITQVLYSLSDSGTVSYGKRFQAILRTGPDIIGAEHVDDDKLIARAACMAAKDSKMTYLTMEAQSAIEAISKWINYVGDKDAAINYLAGISNQRLMRRLCPRCREPYEPNRDMLRKMNIPADKIKQFYRPGQPQVKRGKSLACEQCHGTGFFGREAVFEIILLNDEVKKLLRQAKTKTDIQNIFRHARMLYLQEQAIRKVAAGLTSIHEAIRILSGPQDNGKKPKQPSESEQNAG